MHINKKTDIFGLGVFFILNINRATVNTKKAPNLKTLAGYYKKKIQGKISKLI